MKPYYQDDYVTIYNCRCEDILGELKTDVIITDPPYGINGGTGGTSKLRAKGSYVSNFKDDRDYIKSIVIPSLFNLAKWKSLVLTPGCKNIDLYPKSDSFGVFFSKNSSGMQRFGMSDAHPILYYGVHHLQGRCPLPCSLELNEAPIKNGHPCPKPYKAWKWLVNKSSTDGDIILDPFAGSCTTGRAAKDLNRKCICIELEEKYCEIGAKRMCQEVMNFS